MGEGTKEPALTLFPDWERRTIRKNFARYEWAKGWVDIDGAERSCEEWDDEILWKAVPSQDIGRAMGKAPWYPPCPFCRRPADYEAHDPLRSWKVRCRHCQTNFPANDFHAFFESGRDEKGLFRRERADPSFLVPDPNAPIPAVDDGTGWVDEKGRRHFFIPVACRARWQTLLDLLRQWGRAFLVTGDSHFARKAGLLLYRIAQVYPEMDFYSYAQMGMLDGYGHSRMGRIFGCIVECGVAETCAEVYDIVKAIFTDPNFLATLKALTKRPQSPDEVQGFVEGNLLREMLHSFRERPPRIRGNIGITHLAYAKVALALGDPQALAWLNDKGWEENLTRVFAELVDRDGWGSECSPGYNILWVDHFLRSLDLLERTGGAKVLRFKEVFGASIKRMVKAPHHLLVNGVTPNIGDFGSCGTLRPALLSPLSYVLAFHHFRDPDFAAMAFHANGNRWEGLRLTIHHDAPESIVAAMKERVGENPPSPVPSRSFLRDGYGLAALTTHPDQAEGDALWLWVYFGRNAHFGHSHHDQLNFGLLYRGVDLLPDIGYPDWTIEDPKSDFWVRNTISHNTIIIDRKPQRESWSGQCLGFAETETACFVWLDASGAYRPDSVRRLLLLIPMEKGGYLIDIVWVSGGTEHLLSLHSAPADLGADLEPLTENPFQEAPKESGLPFLAWKGATKTPAVITCHLTDAPLTIRFHFLTDGATVFHAEGETTKRSRWKRLPYLIQRRLAKHSVFVTVIEPYGETPKIDDVTVVPIRPTEDTAPLRPVALHLRHTDGKKDWIFADPKGKRAWSFGDKFLVRGSLLIIRESLKDKEALLWRGDLLQAEGRKITLPASEARGRILEFQKGWGDLWLITDAPIQEMPFTGEGRFFRVFPVAQGRDGAFLWEGKEKHPRGTKLLLGEGDFIVGGREGEWEYLFRVGAYLIAPLLWRSPLS